MFLIGLFLLNIGLDTTHNLKWVVSSLYKEDRGREENKHRARYGIYVCV